MADLRFDAAANAIYHFVWDQFCDWYIELIKPTLSPLPFRGGAGGGASPPGSSDEEKPHPNPSPEEEGLEETRAVAGWVLDQILVMLHPFMPFVTEELWGKLGDRADYPLITAKWPEPGAKVDVAAKSEIEKLIRTVAGIRSVRTELNISPASKLDILIEGASDATLQALENNIEPLRRMARLETIEFPKNAISANVNGTDIGSINSWFAAKGGSAQVVVDEATFIIKLEGIIDIAAEKARLTKALEASTKEAKSLEGRLSNPAFVEKAKPEAVDKARADHAAHAAEAQRLAAALARLG